MEAHANDNPNALSSKRPRVVTRPDVERALVLWVRDMEQKGETISGPMLREKQKRFEDKFQVPETERLLGESWVQSFCNTYKFHEICQHGEAALVDLDAIEAKQLQCQLLANYAPQDHFNMDETAFNPYESYVVDDLSLPNTEIHLQAHLGNRFIDADWRPALQAVMDAEGDPQAAVLAIKPLEQAAMRQPGLKIHISLLSKDLPQLKSAGDKLAQSINKLKA
ncbi:hypothetical protein BS17DRAFT_811334 [Gyrodon lividus]|nr:hypothetical protein BS17DRAFT_811334 [Gyrodon lividus]